VEVCVSVTRTTGTFISYDVVILGAGYAGLMAAVRLGRPKWRLRVALINPLDQFVERVRLQESMVAPIAPRIATAIGESCISPTNRRSTERFFASTTSGSAR